MLRLSDQGIPPHMLHLYENARTQPKTESNTANTRLPSALIKFSAQVLARLKLLNTYPKPDFTPDSAKRAATPPCETQYLGEAKMRDTRWHAL